MKVEVVDIDMLVLDPANVRKHPDRNLEVIKGSLARFGQQKPVVVGKGNVVLAGNGTLAAARSLGWDEIKIVRTDLTGTDATAYAIADNRSAELAEWDDQGLAETLRALQSEDFDLAAVGYTDDEVDALVDGLGDSLLDQSGTEEDGGGQIDRADELQAKWKTATGQLWVIPSKAGKGDHRLLCGDSTKAEDVDRLLVGRKPRLVFSDPPYGYEYQSNMRTKSAKFEVLANDDTILSGYLRHLDRTEGWVLVCTSWKVIREWLDACGQLGELSNVIVWDKGGGGIGDLKHTLSTDYELILAYNRGAEITGKRIGSVWSIGKDAAGDYVHATQKPVKLPAQAYEAFSKPGDTVYDPFCGSGTTIVAAEQSGRICHAIELAPKYVAVILERLADMGLEPYLDSTIESGG